MIERVLHRLVDISDKLSGIDRLCPQQAGGALLHGTGPVHHPRPTYKPPLIS